MQDTDKPNEVSAVNDDREAKPGIKSWLIGILIVLLIAGGASAYWWRDTQARQETADLKAQIADLEIQITELENPPDETDEENGDTNTSKLENIRAAIDASDYAALEQFLASPVNVILAASEAYGEQAPAEAMQSLDFLSVATDPWDFDLPAAALAEYRSGSYAQYFPGSSLTGRSADGYVVSITFDHEGRIGVIFMAPSEGILQ